MKSKITTTRLKNNTSYLLSDMKFSDMKSVEKEFTNFGLNSKNWGLKKVVKRNSKHIDLLYYNIEEPSLKLHALAECSKKIKVQYMQWV